MTAFIRGIRTPLSTTSVPASARTASSRAGNFPSRSRIRNRARRLTSSGSMTGFLVACATHEAVGCALAPGIRTRRLACSITANTYSRAPVKRERLEEVAGRQRVGPEAQEVGPRAAGPLGRRADPGLPQDLPDREGGRPSRPAPAARRGGAGSPTWVFSRARCSTKARMEHGAGRPGHFGLDSAAWRRATRPRCQRSTVSGRTSSPHSTPRGSRHNSTARKTRPPGLKRTFPIPSWRSSTDSRRRRTRISMSLPRSLIGRRRSTANAFTVPKQASRSSTAGHHAALIDSRATVQTRPTASDIPHQQGKTCWACAQTPCSRRSSRNCTVSGWSGPRTLSLSMSSCSISSMDFSCCPAAQ